MARLVVENLTKVFAGPAGERIGAVAGASLIVEDRELLVLVGPSGSGKTTMLRLIAGLEEADSGSVAIAGTVVNRVPAKDRDLAMVFQNYALYPHMSVYENLAFGLKLRKAPRAEIVRRVQEASEMLGLIGCLDRKPEELSGGQRQRVALGRALVRRPQVLLLDEPLSGLDARLRAQMRREICQLQRRLGLTVLYVTHDQMEAMSLGDRVAVMNEGAIQQVATPGDLYQAPCNRFVAEFFGTPPMNFFHGIVEGNGSGLFFRERPFQQTPQKHEEMGQSLSRSSSGQDCTPEHRGFSVRLPDDRLVQMKAHLGSQIILGIRPENIKISAGQTPPESEIKATTDRIELLGSETNVHLATGTGSCVARVLATSGLVLHEKVSLILEMSSAHFFDAVTERRIGI